MSRVFVRAKMMSVFVGFGMAIAGLSHAEPARKTAAESLVQAAAHLMEQKQYAQACPKFEKAQRLDPSLDTLLLLAECHELEGKIATAWAEYRDAAIWAKKEGLDERTKMVTKRAAQLESRVPKLRIDAPHAHAGLLIKRDGRQIGPSALGTAIAVDPGEHTIEAFALGHQPWVTHVKVQVSSGETVVTVPMLLSSTVGMDSHSGQTPHPVLTAGFVMVGAGVLSVGIGAILGASTLADADRARNDPALCPNNICTLAGRSIIHDAHRKATASDVLFIAGGLVAMAGITLIVAAPRTDPKRTHRTMQVIPGTRSIGTQGRD